MPTAKKPARPQAIVVRDETFHRTVADKVVAIDLGRDVELAFLQGSPTVKKLIDWDEDNEQVQLEGGLREVARVRVSGPVALNIAINLIDTLVSAGKVKTAAMMETINQIAARQIEEESKTEQ